MLEVSRAINPDCEHLLGDMRSVRLSRVFDAVFIHDAIMYITTEDDLRRAIETAFIHVKPGGVALLAPDFVRETFRPSTESGGEDGEGRSMRWLDWTFDPNPADDTVETHYVYMLKTANDVTVEHDVHVLRRVRSRGVAAPLGRGRVSDPHRRRQPTIAISSSRSNRLVDEVLA